MKNKRLLTLIGSICLVLVLAALAVMPACAKPAPVPAPAAPAPAPEKVYEWKAIHFGKATEYWYINDFFKAVEEASGGRIKIKAFWLGEHSYKAGEIFTLVRDRVFELGQGFGAYVSAVEPIVSMLEYPFLLSHTDEACALVDDPVLGGPLFRDRLTKLWNQIPLCIFGVPGCMLSLNDGFVTSFDSLKGKNINVVSEELATMVKVFGGLPASLAKEEVYTGLQRGILQGTSTAIGVMYRDKHWEVVKYGTFTDHYPGMFWLAMNKAAFEELPPELQDIVMELDIPHTKIMRQNRTTEQQVTILKSMYEYGAHLTVMSPAFKEEVREKMKPYWVQWAAKTGAESSAALEQILAFHEMWLAKH